MTPTQNLELSLYSRRACPPRQLRLRLSRPDGNKSRARSAHHQTARGRAPRAVTSPATVGRPRSTTKPCRDSSPRPTCTSGQVRTAPTSGQSLTKRLTHARWGLRRQTARLAELREEVDRRERAAAGYRRDVDRLRAELEATDPSALSRLHDVSGGAR